MSVVSPGVRSSHRRPLDVQTEKLTVMCLLVRLELVPQGKGRRAAGMVADVRLRPRRHVRQNDVVSQIVRFRECHLAVLALA